MNPITPMNPYAPPAAETMPYASGPTRFFAQREGNILVVQKEAPLPHVCLKCARRDNLGRHKRTFQYVPPWARFFGVLLIMIFRKVGRLDLSLCKECRARSVRAMIALWACIGVMVLLLVAGSAEDAPAISVIGLFGGLVGLFVVSFVIVRPTNLSATKIDDASIWLAGVHPQAADMVVAAANGQSI